MKIRQLLDRQVSSLVAAVGLLVGVAMPALFPVVAMAANPITARSITMSSSAKGATGVSYKLAFTATTAVAANGGVVIDFCNDTPIVGLTCDTTTNAVNASGATLGTVKYNNAAPASSGAIVATGTNIKWTVGTGFAAGDDIEVTLNGITNPASAGAFYARVVTYVDSGKLGEYQAPNNLGTYADEGGIALATTESIDVTAYVAETLTFCVSGSGTTATPVIPTTGCNNVTPPSLQLGEDQGNGVKVLTTAAVSTGKDYAQLSTNASGGAVVNMHSSATGCGGLVRAGAANCDIKPQNSPVGNVTAGSALFGLMVGPVEDPSGAGDKSGTLLPAPNYDNSKYFIDYNSDETQGVTSTYGSQLFTSDNKPVSNKNMPLVFGVSTANGTPAGIYKASLNLIATGTF